MPSCDNIETRINIDIDFGKLVLLRVFSLHSSVFGFGDQTCDLLRCRYLESVCFSIARPASGQDAVKFATLVHGLAQRPAIKFKMGTWSP